MPQTELRVFCVGQIQKPRGLKGQLRIKSFTSFPEKFKQRKRFRAGKDDHSLSELFVLSAEVKGTDVFLTFESYDTPEKASTLTGLYLFVGEDELGKPKKDTAFVHELLGLKAKSAEGKELGTVTNILSIPSGDLYEITLDPKVMTNLMMPNASAKRNAVILVPAISEFMAEVNVTDGYVIVLRWEEFL